MNDGVMLFVSSLIPGGLTSAEWEIGDISDVGDASSFNSLAVAALLTGHLRSIYEILDRLVIRIPPIVPIVTVAERTYSNDSGLCTRCSCSHSSKAKHKRGKI